MFYVNTKTKWQIKANYLLTKSTFCQSQYFRDMCACAHKALGGKLWDNLPIKACFITFTVSTCHIPWVFHDILVKYFIYAPMHVRTHITQYTDSVISLNPLHAGWKVTPAACTGFLVTDKHGFICKVENQPARRGGLAGRSSSGGTLRHIA